MCLEFWQAVDNRKRRDLLFRNACMLCLGTNQGCTGNKCGNVSTVPLDTVCQTCLQQNALTGRLPANVLVCGLNHAKPHYNDFVQAFEAWVPHFRAAALPTPVSIFLLSGAYKEGVKRIDRNDDLPSAASQQIPQAKQPEKNHRNNIDAPKVTNDEKLVYDTIGGKVRPLHQKDPVIMTSPETPCYIMQTLSISGIDVLTFYDSGTNNNLVNNQVAVEAGFRLLSRNTIRFGVAGGGTCRMPRG